MREKINFRGNKNTFKKNYLNFFVRAILIKGESDQCLKCQTLPLKQMTWWVNLSPKIFSPDRHMQHATHEPLTKVLSSMLHPLN